jgi:hypothetical protein
MKSIGMVVVGFALVACGGGGGLGQPVATFPSRADLEDVMESRAKPVSTLKTVDVPSWRIETPVPAPGAPYPNATIWDTLAAKLVARGGRGKLTSALGCAATETARFYVVNGAFPDDGTRRYFAERCGSTLPGFSIGTLTGDVPQEVSDAEIAGSYESGLSRMLADVPQGGEVGVGVSRANGRVGVVVLAGRPVGRLSGFSPLFTGDSVTLQGQLSKDSAFALALVNQGAYGVATCEPDRSVNLPSFRVTCPIATEDQQTRIEVSTRKPGRVLMEVELQALVRRTEDAGLVYEPVRRGTNALAADASAFQAALFTQLNEVRNAARAPALTLENRQSHVNQRLVPHLYQASTGGDEDLVDQIGLGVLAGWEVGGIIRDGGIYWGSVTSTRSPGRYLTYALESPLARFILLDPSMTRVAVGVEALAPSGAMALLTTYSFFHSKDHTAEENKVFAELDKRRRARKRMPPRRVAKERGLETALAQVASGETNTGDALADALDYVSKTARRSVAGWVVETSDIKQITWPESLLDKEPLEVEIGVTHYKAPGGAWGQYVILVLFYESGSSNTASAPGRTQL